jgi:4-amino-4-deoxy-L-arabinose transferase-like glycosyltransferase/endo-1,4-beta-D-glucanase Y
VHKRLYALILILSFAIFAYGLFSYPHYENDEGIYLSQAWAVLEEQTLSPYTYWYDHAPLGWIILAGWLFLTGGIETFGFSVNSGRVFMLVLHVVSTLMLMVATHRLTAKRIPAYLAGLLFAASPLIVFFGRRVLLDNIMVALLLASIVLLASERRGLFSTVTSAFLFAAAILSKITGIIFLPALFYLVWTRADSKRILHAGVWMALVMLLVSVFPIFSMVKGEFIPTNGAEVTFYDAMVFQLTREGGPIWDASSPIRTSLAVWFEIDPILITIGALSLLILIALAFRTRLARAAFLLLLMPILFLLRGGLVIEFYVLALAPFIILAYAVIIAHVLHATRSRSIAVFSVLVTMSIVIVMAVPLAMSVRTDQNLYRSDQTSVQRQAVFDILEHGTADEAYLVNAYGITEFLAAGFDPLTDPYVEWDVKVETDEKVRDRFERYAEGRKLRFVVSQTEGIEPYTDDFDYLLDRWRSSIRESTLASDGWEVAIFVEHTPEQMLEKTYPSIVRTHLDSGRVVVFYDEDATLLRYQSLMMLAAVRASDAATFDEVWRATRVLEYPNGALRWRDPVSEYDDANRVTTDPASSIMAARALLEAYELWGAERYRRDAQRIADGIWREDVAYTTEGVPYLALANYAGDERSITTKPAAFDPIAFSLLERYDAAHQWRLLTLTSWQVLEDCTRIGDGRLPPEECSVELRDGQVSALRVDRLHELQFGFDASRSLVVLADASLGGDVRAERYLLGLDALAVDWERRGVIATRYTHHGLPIGASESVVYSAPALAAFTVIDPYKASEVHAKKIVTQYFEDPVTGLAYWEDENNVITQLWTYLALDTYARFLDSAD